MVGRSEWEAVICVADNSYTPIGDELDLSFQREGHVYRGRGVAVSATYSSFDCSINVRGLGELEMISHG